MGDYQLGTEIWKWSFTANIGDMTTYRRSFSEVDYSKSLIDLLTEPVVKTINNGITHIYKAINITEFDIEEDDDQLFF